MKEWIRADMLNVNLIWITLALLTLIYWVWFFYQYFKRPKLLPKPFYYDMQFVTIDGFKIPYVQRGQVTNDKPHVLLIHGLAASMYCWRHIIDNLAKDFRVTAFDLPGFGDADKLPDKSYSLDQQCTRVLRFMDELKIEQTYVVAHSMGGALALHLSRQHPLRFKKLVLLAPALYPEIILFNPRHWRWYTNLVKNFIVTPRLVHWINKRSIDESMSWENTDEITNHYYRPYHYSGEAVEILLQHFDLLKDPRPSNDEPVNTPTLILYSLKDHLLHKNSLKRFLNHHPEIKSLEDKISAHQMMEENPGFVLAATKKFFEIQN